MWSSSGPKESNDQAIYLHSEGNVWCVETVIQGMLLMESNKKNNQGLAVSCTGTGASAPRQKIIRFRQCTEANVARILVTLHHQ